MRILLRLAIAAPIVAVASVCIVINTDCDSWWLVAAVWTAVMSIIGFANVY